MENYIEISDLMKPIMEKLEKEEPDNIHNVVREGTIKTEIVDKETGEIIRARYRTYSTEESKTQQHHISSMRDIVNNYDRRDLLKRFKGVSPEVVDDVSITDWKETMDKYLRVKDSFENVPSELRKKFKTPEEYLKYMRDPSKIAEQIEMGLREKPVKKKPIEVKVVSENPVVINGDSPQDKVKE